MPYSREMAQILRIILVLPVYCLSERNMIYTDDLIESGRGVVVKLLASQTKCCYFDPPLLKTINDLSHDKNNKMVCAPNKDSDQPGHPPSLIRVFSVRLKKPWFLSYPLSAQRRL